MHKAASSQRHWAAYAICVACVCPGPEARSCRRQLQLPFLLTSTSQETTPQRQRQRGTSHINLARCHCAISGTAPTASPSSSSQPPHGSVCPNPRLSPSPPPHPPLEKDGQHFPGLCDTNSSGSDTAKETPCHQRITNVKRVCEVTVMFVLNCCSHYKLPIRFV